jgi:hypothetical protein
MTKARTRRFLINILFKEVAIKEVIINTTLNRAVLLVINGTSIISITIVLQ